MEYRLEVQTGARARTPVVGERCQGAREGWGEELGTGDEAPLGRNCLRWDLKVTQGQGGWSGLRVSDKHTCGNSGPLMGPGWPRGCGGTVVRTGIRPADEAPCRSPLGPGRGV